MNLRSLVLAIGLLATAAVVVHYALRGSDAPLESTGSGERPPRYELNNVRWKRMDENGRLEFRAHAAQLRQYHDDAAELTGLQLDALGGLDSPWQIRAPSGTVPSRQKRIRLNGPVVAQGRLIPNEPAELTAENLWVDTTQKLLSTDGRVGVKTPTRSARARGLRTDFKGQNLYLLHDVEVTYVHTP